MRERREMGELLRNLVSIMGIKENQGIEQKFEENLGML